VATLEHLLQAAVAGVGGATRPGQQQMANAVAEAIHSRSHLLVQAGTGTGKSLAYLVPAVQHAVDTGRPVVVATATIALQAQIVDRDLPRLAAALAPGLGRRPTFAMVKGRRNYVCVHKLGGGYPDDDEGLLSVSEVDQAAGRLGREVVRLRRWAEATESGDRDELVPGVSERAWRQVSVSAHECLGGTCPTVTECFVERSRAAAADVDVIVTNHSFMAIDSFEGRQMLPAHHLLVVDEAHELVDRVTSTITDELTSGMLTGAARKAGKRAESGEQAADAAALLDDVLAGMPEGRVLAISDSLALALARVRDVARAMQSDDVGSPFDYPKQGIAYVAQHLPPPGRDGLAGQTLDEIEALVRAAGGRTLGLFSSMRAAKEATEAMRERFADKEGEIAFLCQGEDQISTLVRQFARDPRVCLFGTLSLWQGVDVPGSSCQLVIIDRIPFPRPDDPLASARSQAIARMGGNGFMAVSATHAALRLAQGAGRLIRRSDDRGVVAFLDNRMMTARYAGFLQRSLPPFWPTSDRAMVLSALARLDEIADPPLPVAEPALRGLTGALAAPVGDPARGADAVAPVPLSRPVAEAPPPPESSRTAVTHGHAWTEQEDEELRDGIELGLTLDELSESMELPTEVLAARLAGLGLEAGKGATLTFD
jgi:Rad3-related DNA helicase